MQLLVHVLADPVALALLKLVEQFLDFLKVVPIVVLLVVDRWVEGSRDFDFHHVADVLVGIQIPFAKVARIVNH